MESLNIRGAGNFSNNEQNYQESVRSHVCSILDGDAVGIQPSGAYEATTHEKKVFADAILYVLNRESNSSLYGIFRGQIESKVSTQQADKEVSEINVRVETMNLNYSSESNALSYPLLEHLLRNDSNLKQLFYKTMEHTRELNEKRVMQIQRHVLTPPITPGILATNLMQGPFATFNDTYHKKCDVGTQTDNTEIEVIESDNEDNVGVAEPIIEVCDQGTQVGGIDSAPKHDNALSSDNDGSAGDKKSGVIRGGSSATGDRCKKRKLGVTESADVGTASLKRGKKTQEAQFSGMAVALERSMLKELETQVFTGKGGVNYTCNSSLMGYFNTPPTHLDQVTDTNPFDFTQNKTPSFMSAGN